MRLKLRLIGMAGGARDIVVTVDAVATVGELATALLERDPTGNLDPTGTLGLAEPTLSVGYPGSASVVLDAGTAVAEARIASGSEVRVVSGEHAPGSEREVLAVLRVESGPSAGLQFEVGPGAVFIGRDASSTIVIDDPRMSKRHARVEVSSTIDFIDLNSANGVVVQGDEVARASIRSGESVLLGDSLVRGEILGRANGIGHPGPPGPVEFNRAPRVEERFAGRKWDAPEVPRAAEPTAFPWIALVAPLVLGGVMFFVMRGNPASIAFVALSPVLMLGTFVTQKLRSRAQQRERVAEFSRRLASLTATMDSEVERERRVRLEEAPSIGRVMRHAASRGPLLWNRRPEHWNFLTVRLGLAAAPSRSTIVGRDDPSGMPVFAEQLTAVVDAFSTITGVPVVDNVSSAGALGVAGSIAASTEMANSVIAQLAGLHSPQELSVTAIMGAAWSAGFEWLAWLPHTGAANAPVANTQLASTAPTAARVIAGLEQLIADRRAASSVHRGPASADDSVMMRGAAIGERATATEPPPLPCVVVLITDDAPVHRGRLVAVVERAAEAGIVVIWVAESVQQLPAACRTFVDLGAAQRLATVGMVRTGERIEGVAVESLASSEALTFARRLACVSDSGALDVDERDIPTAVALLDLVGAEMAASPDAVIDRWRQNDSIHDRTPGAVLRPRKAGRLRALVGQTAGEAMHLDLRSQGPHALVGGTTGAGKSEFLQAWVLGMAAEYSPDRVSFLLVDYKGGAAFADCVDLPHTVGLVTDLSPHLVRRALTSLRAELRHREQLLNRAKAKDLIELENRGDPLSPPALVIVIDEFAALAGEIPEFVDGVVDIAQRGRSLGIHLIMATQRPAGVIRDSLRANTNLRIALRMADESDSTDVIGTPIAAAFDPALPGRAVAKTAHGRLSLFHAGFAGGWTTDARSAPAIEIADLAVGPARIWHAPKAEEHPATGALGPTDAARLVATFTAAARAADVPIPRRPWLDELSAVYEASTVVVPDDEIVLGVADDAENQRQYPVAFRPDSDGGLAIFGTGGAGKSTALRTIAIAAGGTGSTHGSTHVYGLDFGSGGLRMLDSLPHVGAIIAGDDTERTGRMLTMLRDTVTERSARYSAVRAGTIVEYRALANRPGEPRILLLIDGMAAFRQEYEFATAPVFAMLQQVLGDGRQVGVHVVITADRPSAVPSGMAASLQRRLMLRLADDADYRFMGVPGDVLSASSPPGRALLDQLETQVAVFGATRSVAGQAVVVDRLCGELRNAAHAVAPPIERLAERIALASISGAVPGSLAIGVADDTLEPVGIEASGAFLLAGPAASGRSTALQTLTASFAASYPSAARFHLSGAPSDLTSLPGWGLTTTGVDAVAASARELRSAVAAPATPDSRVLVVIEAVSELLGTAAEAELLSLVTAAKRNRHFVIAESESSTWSQLWPLLMEFKSARRGFVLQPDTVDGDMLFKTAFGRVRRSEFVPGRGMLVQAGVARKVQFAIP